ncbi:MAG: sulfite exporter TauE/SafE family protein, partial [Burkholderiaceae bacterium]
MTLLFLLPIFLVGLFGGVHCVGMCGGIVGAFAVATPRQTIPIRVDAVALRVSMFTDAGLRVLVFNLGRIGSYMLAGALAGLIGSVPLMINLASVQTVAYWLANLT